jgi:hypothetical protein
MKAHRIVIIVLASVLVTLGAAVWAHAQAPQVLPAPTVISGSDIGFRVDPIWTQRQGKVSGRWVVRINGEWVEPSGVPAPRSLASR